MAGKSAKNQGPMEGEKTSGSRGRTEGTVLKNLKKCAKKQKEEGFTSWKRGGTSWNFEPAQNVQGKKKPTREQVHQGKLEKR